MIPKSAKTSRNASAILEKPIGLSKIDYNKILIDETAVLDSVGGLVAKKKRVETNLDSANSNPPDYTDRNALGDSICSLMGQARDGCQNSRSELLAQLRSYLAIVVSSRLNPKFQAKFGESDVVQQSIAVALEKFDDFRGQSEGELFGWAKTILRNEILQQQRALLSDKRDMFREQQLEVSNEESGFQRSIEDVHLTPKTNAIRKEQSQAVASAISRLPADYQEIIRLRNSEQLPFAEIGKRMNKSENAVTKLWFRALVQLRKELEVDNV